MRISETGALLDAAFPIGNSINAECRPSLLAGAGATSIATTRFVTTGGFYCYRVGLSRVGGPPCAADFDGSGTLGVQDVFDFLAASFVGCL